TDIALWNTVSLHSTHFFLPPRIALATKALRASARESDRDCQSVRGFCVDIARLWRIMLSGSSRFGNKGSRVQAAFSYRVALSAGAHPKLLTCSGSVRATIARTPEI